jgi:hypothetical protein
MQRLPLTPIIYRVHSAMLGIVNLDGERVPVTIPANSELSVAEAGCQGRAEGTMLKVADWNATRVMVFMQDLENRAIALDNDLIK